MLKNQIGKLIDVITPLENGITESDGNYQATLARSLKDVATVVAMKELVPEFRSNHSKYEALEK